MYKSSHFVNYFIDFSLILVDLFPNSCALRQTLVAGSDGGRVEIIIDGYSIPLLVICLYQWLCYIFIDGASGN